MSDKSIYDIVYVTGHKNPDTDSIVSAIAYAHLKQQQQVNAFACRLGEINDETKYILERFNFRSPMLLLDARSQLDEIEMDHPISISPETTINEVLKLKDQTQKQVFSVVNHLNQLQGIVTQSNLSSVLLGDTAKSIDLLSRTPIEYISKTIEGRLILAPDSLNSNGKVSIIAVSTVGIGNYDLENRIVIVGNDTQVQLECIEKGAALLVIVWATTVAPIVIQAAKEKNCGIIISGHGTTNTSRYIFYSPAIRELMHTDMVVFNKAEFVEDVTKKVMLSRFRSYPVVDDQNHVFGFVSRYHLLNAKKKQLILVDHNEINQSVSGIEHAEIVEVVDHNKIGDIKTTKPINFRNETLGSTSTIIAKMYFEQGIEIPPNYAGILLGAMISDTLNFKSPTTTVVDLDIAKKLADIAQLDIEAYAHDIFSISNSLKDKSIEEILNYDVKEFDIKGKRVMISQFIMYQLNELMVIKDRLIEGLQQYVQTHRVDLVVLVFTSVHKNGSVFYAAGELQDCVELAFPNKPNEQHSFMDGVVSRKNQIVPKISLAINQMM